MCQNCDDVNWDSTQRPKHAGSCYGIDFFDLPYVPAGETKAVSNPQFRVFVEDDGLWHMTKLSGSVHWLNDLAQVFKEAASNPPLTPYQQDKALAGESDFDY